jgi:ATP phosphoribosyltransferase
MDKTLEVFASCGLNVRKVGHNRGYRGTIEGIDNIEVVFLSASEIAGHLRIGRIHLGVTGEDLIREQIVDSDEIIEFIKPLGLGRADVVVAVPKCWLDVHTVADIEDSAAKFRNVHGYRMRVATKYTNITRRYFAANGIFSYRMVASSGATEGAPAAGMAEIIVDITSSGETLKANQLKIPEDGIIMRSEANLVASKVANWSPEAKSARQIIEPMLCSDENDVEVENS